MFRFAFLVYVVVEVLAVALVGNAIGAGWTIMLLIAGSAAGMLLFAAQGRKVVDGIGQVSRGERSAGGVVADSTLGAAGVGLLLVPGLVTSVLGVLALLPPTRWLLRPVVLAIARRRSPMVANLVGERGAPGPLDNGFEQFVRRQSAGGDTGVVFDGDIVDGSVVEGSVVDSPSDAQDINPLRPGIQRPQERPGTPNQ